MKIGVNMCAAGLAYPQRGILWVRSDVLLLAHDDILAHDTKGCTECAVASVAVYWIGKR